MRSWRAVPPYRRLSGAIDNRCRFSPGTRRPRAPSTTGLAAARLGKSSTDLGVQGPVEDQLAERLGVVRAGPGAKAVGRQEGTDGLLPEPPGLLPTPDHRRGGPGDPMDAEPFGLPVEALGGRSQFLLEADLLGPERFEPVHQFPEPLPIGLGDVPWNSGHIPLNSHREQWRPGVGSYKALRIRWYVRPTLSGPR